MVAGEPVEVQVSLKMTMVNITIRGGAIEEGKIDKHISVAVSKIQRETPK